MLPGTLEPERELDEDAVPLLVDPAGVVPVVSRGRRAGHLVAIALDGVGLLAVTVIGFGFPLGDRRYKKAAQE